MQAHPENYQQDSKLFEQSPFYEQMATTYAGKKKSEVIEALSKPYVLKTHLNRYELADRPEKPIYIARNPLDAALSSFFHAGRDLCNDPDYKPWHLKSACANLMPWTNHIKDWHDFNEDEKQPLFLTYEEMQKDYYSVLLKLCNFCEIDPAKIDFEKVKQYTSFSEMKKIEETLNHPTSGAPLKNFCRNGTIGDWKNHLRPDMVKMVYDQYYDHGIDKYYGSLEDWADMHDWIKEHPTFNQKS
jgi:hypothetical protein